MTDGKHQYSEEDNGLLAVDQIKYTLKDKIKERSDKNEK